MSNGRITQTTTSIALPQNPPLVATATSIKGVGYVFGSRATSGFRIGCLVPFTEEWLPSGHYHKGLIGGVLQRCFSFSHLHRGTLELCQSDHQVLGHLPEQGPSPPIAQFGRVASSRKSIGGSKRRPFKNDGGYCVLGLSMQQTFFATLPQICASTQSCLGALRGIPLTSWLDFFLDMHCQLWDLI
jgi:hypothetical protein